MKPASIFLVDDHVVVRNGLKTLIERLGNYTVTGEFDNGQQLVSTLLLQGVPDLIILDLNMPVMDGVETMKWIKKQHVVCPVLVLTLNEDENIISYLFKLGVRGYIAKNSTAPLLFKAINDVLRSGYHENEFLFKVVGDRAPHDNKETPANALKQVSERELQFLRLVCSENEYTYKEIAEIMGIHPRTVDGYRESLFNKFNIKAKPGLILFAFKNGLIS